MTEPKHTPGPWNVVLRGTRGTFHIPEAQQHEATAAETDGVDGHTVSSANAALIKAAPDLLEALRACLAELESLNKGIGWRDGEWHSVAVARAAIALATPPAH